MWNICLAVRGHQYDMCIGMRAPVETRLLESVCLVFFCYIYIYSIYSHSLVASRTESVSTNQACSWLIVEGCVVLVRRSQFSLWKGQGKICWTWGIIFFNLPRVSTKCIAVIITTRIIITVIALIIVGGGGSLIYFGISLAWSLSNNTFWGLWTSFKILQLKTVQ